MPHRLRELEHAVSLTHDGESLRAELGEPLAVALCAGHGYALSRSPKLHRPRGPYCFRGACEGCLVRVDGVPNVMACQRRVRGGEQVETQNVIGSRELDLLGATDYLFPRGMDHHRLFAGVRGVSSLVQAFAHHVSGLGVLPEANVETKPATRQQVDVLVVGGGRAGLGAALELGAKALVVDDQPEPGGALALLAPPEAARLAQRVRESGARLWPATTVVGLYREPDDGSGRLTALLVGENGATLVRCRSALLAPGCHDAAPSFENNDLPGVLSARAALALLRAGVAPGKRVLVVGEGRFARCFVDQSRGHLQTTELEPESVVRALGRPELTGLRVRGAGAERRLRADAVVFDAPGAPAFELAVQAGAEVRFDPTHGYVPVHDAQGKVAEGVYVAGSASAGAVTGEAAARVALENLA